MGDAARAEPSPGQEHSRDQRAERENRTSRGRRAQGLMGEASLARKARWDSECVGLGGSCLKRAGSDGSARGLLRAQSIHPSGARTARLQDSAEEGQDRQAEVQRGPAAAVAVEGAGFVLACLAS